MKKLPIGIQTFEEIIKEDYLYVDKTKQIYDLITTGKTYFISRPRRFGKSLLCSTLEQIFKGNKELFKNLWIYNSDYSWKKYSVIRIDMSSLVTESLGEFKVSLNFGIESIAKRYNIKVEHLLHPKDRIKCLIDELGMKNKVVVIIDEYDKPILDNIKNVVVAEKIRDMLRDVYSQFKSLDEHLKFVFLTGVSKFSKTSVFSGLNNLYDLTFNERVATLFGYTQKELEFYFDDRIRNFAKALKTSRTQILLQLKDWYDGYSFVDGKYKIYNPFSILLSLNDSKFKNYWFETGTPTFLLNLIKEKNFDYSDSKSFEAREQELGNFEIDDLSVKTILFQAGYLTIRRYDSVLRRFYLGYPNIEVKESFLECILYSFTQVSPVKIDDTILDFVVSLEQYKVQRFIDTLKSFFSQIPYTIQNRNEKYYQSIFFTLLKLLGVRINVEVATNIGRIDAVVEMKEYIYIIEFKVDCNSKKALRQIEEKKYYEKYVKTNKNIVLVGINFDTQEKNISDFDFKLA